MIEVNSSHVGGSSSGALEIGVMVERMSSRCEGGVVWSSGPPSCESLSDACLHSSFGEVSTSCWSVTKTVGGWRNDWYELSAFLKAVPDASAVCSRFSALEFLCSVTWANRCLCSSCIVLLSVGEAAAHLVTSLDSFCCSGEGLRSVVFFPLSLLYSCATVEMIKSVWSNNCFGDRSSFNIRSVACVSGERDKWSVFVASCDSFVTFVFALISSGGVVNVGSVRVHCSGWWSEVLFEDRCVVFVWGTRCDRSSVKSM